MYRSLVTCDDPKGVVECGTIRKCKSVSQKREDNIKSHRTQKNSNTSLAYKAKKEKMVPKVNTEDYHSPSSFQLGEVSRGAQKLNHLIDSWSKGLSYDGQSKDIAKDLLKGALDLQESLTMLGKLQEASQYMAQLKKKQKEKLERGRIDELGSERMNSRQYGDQNQQLGLQKPRLSTDGSSRDCVHELRNAIRESLARQNLLPKASSQEKIRYDTRRMDSISHIPSTSSSQFSVMQSDNNHSTASSSSQTATNRKEKSPNVIAKLMGLEDIPSKPLMQSPQKQMDLEKNPSPRKPVIDIEMPKLRKPQSTIQKADSEPRTLKEIFETVQLQGLLKSSSAKELKSESHQSSDYYYKQKLTDDFPPIVLIKPMRVSRSESEEVPSPMIWEERDLSRKMMLRKMKIRERLALRSIDGKKRVTSDSCKMPCRTEAEESPMERVIQEEGAKDHIEVVVIPEEKEVRTINQKESDVTVNKVQRKLKAEKAPMKRHIHEEGAKDCKEVVIRAEEKGDMKKLKESSKIKVSNPATRQQQKKETTDKKVDKVRKVVASSRQPVEKEIVKSKNVTVSPDQAKSTSTRLRKPDTVSITTNDHISQHRTSTRKPISKHTTQNTIHNSNNRKQKEKQASEHALAKPTIENIELKEDEKKIDLSCNNHSQKEGSTIIVADHLSMKEEANISNFQTKEHCDDSQSSLCIITAPASECGINSKSSAETDDQMTQIVTDSTSLKTGNQLKDLLLSSPSFLNLAEEAFHLNMSYPKISPINGIYDWGNIDIDLFLDYANEFIARRSLPDSQTRHPLLSYTGNSRIYLSLEKLVEEVCSGIETLRSYHKLACNEFSADSLCATLERDMKCNEVVSGIWDLGWRNACSSEDIEQTVNDLEKFLVSELIGEVFS